MRKLLEYPFSIMSLNNKNGFIIGCQKAMTAEASYISIGEPGKGMSFSLKKQLINEDKENQTIILDPENEFENLKESSVTQTTGSGTAPGDPFCVTNLKESEG